MEFKIGDLAVYPGYGVGKIVNVECKEIMGATTEFLSIELLENGSKLMVPKLSAAKKGLRPIVTANDTDKIIDILQSERTAEDKKLDTQTWNRRHREYTERIKTGSLYEIAQVFRDLYLLKADKELSFGEKKMLETAKGLLVKEMSIATNVSEDTMGEKVEQFFQA